MGLNGIKHTIVRVLLIVSLLTLTVEKMFSSRIIPQIKSFEKFDYNAGRQNWAITKDDNGVIYFANTDGLLCNIFGEWKLYTLEKGGSARALHVKNDTIWIGGIGEFGYFLKNNNNSLEYNKIGDLDGEIIWDIIEYENEIIYLTYFHLIIFNKHTKQVTFSNYSEEFWTIIEWSGELWAITTQGIIGVIRDSKFYPREIFTTQITSEVRDVFIHNNQLIIVSSDDIFIYDKVRLTKFDFKNSLDNAKFFTGCSFNKETVLLGTVTKGLLSVNWETGEYVSFGTIDGLLDNTVLSLCTDEENNIWLGLDYGIAKIVFKNTIYPIFNNGATYHIQDVENKIYLSTNKGAFVSEDNQSFQFIKNTSGQVWRIRSINNRLYMCHNEGLYLITDNKLLPLYEEIGIMDIAQFGETNYYLLSAYSGLLLVKYIQGKFHLISNLYVWGNPKLYYDPEADCIWGDTKKKPVIQFKLKKDDVEIKQHEGIERFFNTQSGLVFYNGLSLMSYEAHTNQFIKIDKAPYTLLAEEGVTALDISDNNGAIAYVANDEIKLFVTLPDGTVHSYEKYISAIKSNLIKSDPFLNIKNNELRIATDRGVTVFNMGYQSSPIQKVPVITSINIGSKGAYQKIFFPFKKNTINLAKGKYNLQFQFTSPYSDSEFTEFRYKLTPYDKEWTEWESKINKKEYTKISGGEYLFLLQTRVNQSVVKEAALNIKIAPYWFQNLWIVIPIITVFLIFFGYVAYLIIEVIKEKIYLNRLAYEKRLKQEAVESKNEQLMQYLEIISHKNSFLQEIKDILSRMRNTEANRCVNKIDEELNNEKKNFIYHKLFSENNQELIIRVSKEYPNLTENDIRILTLIRANMSSKEIAAILNISNSSFDTSRYRIRKKLGLNHEENLNSFVRDL